MLASKHLIDLRTVAPEVLVLLHSSPLVSRGVSMTLPGMIALLSLLLVGVLGCEKVDLCPEATPGAKKAANKVANFKPRLPEAPDYDKLTAQPLKASNGAWTVYGISMNRRALLGEQIRVKGRIGERNLCTDRKGCPQRPYVMLGDANTKKFSLMVVRENDKGFHELPAGETITLVGKLVDHTGDGKLFRSEGILVIPPGEDPLPPEVQPETVP